MARVTLRKTLKRIPGVYEFQYTIQQRRAMYHWYKRGMPVPPPHRVKADAVIEYGTKYGAENLVETGTFLGHMLIAARKHFKRIISIELSHELAELNKQQFKRYTNVEIIEGDSATVIPNVLKTLKGKTVFWLDAHYSGSITAHGIEETPIVSEIKTIATWNQPDTIILIDDARLFDGKGYPELNAFLKIVKTIFPKHSITIKNDSIRIAPH